MGGKDDRRKQRLRKTKAELVDELEAMERTLSGLEAVEQSGPEEAVSWRFRALMDNAPTAIFLRDVEGRYILVNKAYEDLYGVDGRKVVGKMPEAVFAGESVGLVMDIHREVLEKRCRIDRETEVTIRDGTKRAQWATVFPLMAPDGVAIGVCGVLTDLAETKRAEHEAQVSQERMLAAIDSMQEAFCLYDADDKLIAANEKYTQIRPASKDILKRGGSFEDMVRANVAGGLFADTKGREEEFIRQRVDWHRNLKGPFVQKDADGTWWMLNETRTPEGGTAISLVDITQLKDAEAALRDSEERFRLIVEQAADAFFVHDLDGKFLDVSRKACESLGYSRNELLKLSVADVNIGIDIEAFKAQLREMRPGTPATYNGIHKRKNGTTFPVEISVNIFIRDDESVAVALVRDVTDRKRAEEARDQLAQAVENVPIGIALFDPDDSLVFFNGQYGELLAPIRDVLVPGTKFDTIIRAAADAMPDSNAIGRKEDYIRERLEQHRAPKGPIRSRRPDKWLEINETRLPDDSTFVLVSDITVQKRTEEALRKSDALFRAVVNHSPHKIHIKDVDGRYVLINKEAERLFGVTDEDGRGKNSYDLFDKETADAFVAHDRAVMESGIPTEAEETFTLEDGDHTFLTVKFPVYDLDGVAGVGAIGTDITDRKRAEEALRETETIRQSEELLRTIFETSPAGIAIVSLETNKRLYINPAMLELFGASSADELLQADLESTYANREDFERLRADMDGDDFINEIEIERLRLDGTPWWCLQVRRRIEYQGHRALLSWHYDITERRKAEEEVRKLNEELEERVEERTRELRNEVIERIQAEQELDRQKTRFEAVFRDVPDAMVLTDLDRRIMMCNPAMIRTFGYEEAEIVGKDLAVLYADADEFRRQGHIRFNLSAEERLEPYVVDYRRKDGEIFPGESVGAPIRGADGGTQGFIGVIRDVTDRVQAEQALMASEQRFKELVESSSDWLWEMDADLRFTYFSDRYPEMTGIRVEDRIGTYRTDHLPDLERQDQREKWEAHLADLKARRPFRNFEYVARAADGSLRWRRVNGNPIFDSDGNFLGYRGTGTNITARKHAEEALKESQARLANILDNSPSPIYFKDREGRFLIANRRFQELYDVDFEEIQGRNSKEIFGAGLGEAFFEHDQEVLRSRQVIEKEESIFGRTYLTLKFPIVDASGELLGLGGIETDVTELKQVESELRGAKEDAEFANRAKTEFLANMSHELRTPLNSILGFSEILMSETFGSLGSDLYREYAGDIHDSGTHLLSLISEVLDLSKLEAGELEIFESQIDVTDAISSCVKMVESRHGGNQPTVSAKFSNGLPMFQGDERRFKQILLNLLGNAVKFTPPTGEVTVSAGICGKGCFTIKVADSGIGIAPDDIPKVLEPFGQVRDVLTRDHEGTGLGLYLAKSFTEMHGGTLDIESDVGQGTTVTLRFPKERTLALH